MEMTECRQAIEQSLESNLREAEVVHVCKEILAKAVAGYGEEIPDLPADFLYARPTFGGCSVTLKP